MNSLIKLACILTYTLLLVACSGNSEESSALNSVTTPALDTVPPVIVLNGSSSITLEVGSTFKDPGARATDNVSGVVEVTASNPNTENVGRQEVVYTAIDAAGNASTVKRELIVEPPPTATIMLEWVAPEFRLDGAPLSLHDIVGYRIYMGNNDAEMDVIAVVDEPTTHSVKVENLVRGIYYLSISAVDENQLESPASEPVRVIL